MIKNIICLLLIALCATTFAGCVAATDSNNDTLFDPSTQATTIQSISDISDVNEDKVILDDVSLYDAYAVLPLCDVITGLGFRLIWDDTDHATFSCNEIEYEISLSEKSLTKAGDNVNYLICAPGNKHFVCEVMDGALVVDDNTLVCLFNSFMHYPINVSIDRANNCVVVAKR